MPLALPLPLALTLGEPAGIGPDLAAAVFRRRAELDLPPFYVLGDPSFLARRSALTGAPLKIVTCAPQDAAAVFPTALPVVDTGAAATAAPGTPDHNSAGAALAAITLGVEHVLAGRAAALVTNPIAKNVLYQSGFQEPGHTEFLAKLAAAATGVLRRPVMMLWSPELAVVPVTIHLPLAQVPAVLDTDLIVATGEITARDLASRFGIARPRIAVAGLNPHAGEDGAMGSEDRDVVAPAVERLRRLGIDARGPLPADTLFHAGARVGYDAALCMYHDQALIPIKTLAFEHAVNVTLGLPLVRTSPDHGTAFDIAGTTRGDPSSLVAALRLAAALSGRGPARPGETAPA